VTRQAGVDNLSNVGNFAAVSYPKLKVYLSQILAKCFVMTMFKYP